jgi:hypothetical protein
VADTQRTKAELETLLADNTTQQISPQDLRDLLESVAPSFGSLYVTTPAATTISGSGVWTKALGTTTDVSTHRFSGKTILGVDNRLRYDGIAETHLHAVITFSMSVATGSNISVEAAAYHYDASAVSGSIIAHSIVSHTLASTSIETGALHFDIMVDTNDYLEFHLRNMTNTTSLTVNNLYLFAMGMLH